MSDPAERQADGEPATSAVRLPAWMSAEGDSAARRAPQLGYHIIKLADGRVMAERLGVRMPLAHMALALGDHHRGMMPADLPGPPPADAEESDFAGDRDARRLLLALRDGAAPADLLLQAFDQVRATNDAERLRAFARHVQCALKGQA